MQFELIKINQKKQRRALLYGLVTVILLFVLLKFFGVQSNIAYISSAALLLLFLLINNLFTQKLYGEKVKLIIAYPLNISLKNDKEIFLYSDIEKWDWSQNPKTTTCTVTLINKGIRHNLIFEGDNNFSDFINYFQKAIKQHNQEGNNEIKNLRKEFHNSRTSKTILYTINFVFLALLYFDYPDITWGVCLGISMLFTIFYAVAYYSGKNIEV